MRRLGWSGWLAVLAIVALSPQAVGTIVLVSAVLYSLWARRSR